MNAFLVARSSKSRCQQGWFLLGALREILLHVLVLANIESGNFWYFLACGHITPNFAFIFIWCFLSVSVCLCLFSSYKDLVIGFRSHFTLEFPHLN